MNTWQENHLECLKQEHDSELEAKYRAGAKKHKGDLRMMSAREALEEALQENIDQYVYIKKALDEL